MGSATEPPSGSGSLVPRSRELLGAAGRSREPVRRAATSVPETEGQRPPGAAGKLVPNSQACVSDAPSSLTNPVDACSRTPEQDVRAHFRPQLYRQHAPPK